tara:strand:- start:1709 stop:2644 length:936 start_codon:yes stop_codon:yes gene_type:complete
LFGSSFGTYTVSQSSTSPDGFANSLKLDCTTADASPAAGDHLGVQMKFEGQDLQQLQKGTSTAKSVTVSFFVRSNKTGTYTLELDDRDNTRSFSKTYTIDSADTWEHKTVTFAGDTTGVLDDDNANSFHVGWWLMAGSNFTGGTFTTGWEARTNANRISSSNVNLSDSTSNEWYMTGVQFELGEQAQPFEHRSFGDELARCQRYYYKLKSSSSNNFFGYAMAANTTAMYLAVPFPVEMRSNPTSIDVTAGSSGNIGYWLGGAVTAFTSIGISESGPSMTTLVMQVSSGLSGEKMYGVLPNGSGSIGFSSEL